MSMVESALALEATWHTFLSTIDRMFHLGELYGGCCITNSFILLLLTCLMELVTCEHYCIVFLGHFIDSS
jgi:hypothetical protein